MTFFYNFLHTICVSLTNLLVFQATYLNSLHLSFSHFPFTSQGATSTKSPTAPSLPLPLCKQFSQIYKLFSSPRHPLFNSYVTNIIFPNTTLRKFIHVPYHCVFLCYSCKTPRQSFFFFAVLTSVNSKATRSSK